MNPHFSGIAMYAAASPDMYGDPRHAHGHDRDALRVLDIPTRDAIPACQRYEGLWVLVLADKKFYRLIGGLSNDCWVSCGTGHGNGGDISPDDLPIASKTAKGIVQIGDNINVDTNGLIAVANAAEDAAGVVELASVDEAKAGTDATKAVTPAGLAEALNQDKVDHPIPTASKTVKGIVQIGDNISVDTNGLIAVATASENAAGVVELATLAEAQAGTDTTKAVTPAGLADVLAQDKVDHPLPSIATTTTAGLVKASAAFAVDRDGIPTVHLVTPRVGNLTVFIAHDGNDNNVGLSAMEPFKTVNKALQYLSMHNWMSGGTVTLSFGPGFWGDLSIFGHNFHCNAINITATNIIDMPIFGQLYVRAGNLFASYIEANRFCALNFSTININGNIKTAGVLAQEHSRINISTCDVIVKDIEFDDATAYGQNYGSFINSSYNSGIYIAHPNHNLVVKFIFTKDYKYSRGFVWTYEMSGVFFTQNKLIHSGTRQTGSYVNAHHQSHVFWRGATYKGLFGNAAAVLIDGSTMTD